jgi:hypothetical protein
MILRAVPMMSNGCGFADFTYCIPDDQHGDA